MTMTPNPDSYVLYIMCTQCRWPHVLEEIEDQEKARAKVETLKSLGLTSVAWCKRRDLPMIIAQHLRVPGGQDV